MQECDFWGHCYFTLFVCAKSRYKFIYLLFNKNDIQPVFQSSKCWAEKQFSRPIKVLHTDGGDEFREGEFQKWLVTQGIQHVTTPPYSPDMNGACEVWNRVIVHTASAMLLAANLPISLWGQESLCAIYLLNRSPTKGLHLRCTSYEVLHGQKPYIGHIRTWGCRAYAHIPQELRKKWDSHSCECLLMGFYDSENLFQLYDIAANSIIKVHDVIFFEDILGHGKFQHGCGRKLQPGMVITETQSPLGTTANADTVDIVTPDPTNDASIRNSLAVLVHSNEMAYLAFSATLPPPVAPSPLILNFNIPKSYKSAMQSPQASEWKKACDAEFEALQHNNTWSLVPRIPNMVVIQHK